VCCAVVGAAPCYHGLCFATCSEAHHFSQPATRQLSCSGAFLLKKKKRKYLLFPLLSSMPFCRPIFKHGIFKSAGHFQKICSVLGFTFNITTSQVRPMPRAIGSLTLIFFPLLWLYGKKQWAWTGVGRMFVVLPL